MKRLVFLLLASLTGLSPVHASGDAGRPEAHLVWRMAFGGSLHGIRTGYALTAGYRPADPGLPVPMLFEFDVSDHAAIARLAGMPLFKRAYTANQDEAEDISTAAPAETPWYANQWVWWTAGGLVAATALSVGSGDDEPSNDVDVSAGGACIARDNSVNGDDELPDACVPESGASGETP